MTKARVLFLCTGNSARSQMAEALLRQKAGDRFIAYSAGLEPQEVNPLAKQVMAEIGIDISAQRAKSVTEFLPRAGRAGPAYRRIPPRELTRRTAS